MLTNSGMTQKMYAFKTCFVKGQCFQCCGHWIPVLLKSLASVYLCT